MLHVIKISWNLRFFRDSTSLEQCCKSLIVIRININLILGKMEEFKKDGTGYGNTGG